MPIMKFVIAGNSYWENIVEYHRGWICSFKSNSTLDIKSINVGTIRHRYISSIVNLLLRQGRGGCLGRQILGIAEIEQLTQFEKNETTKKHVKATIVTKCVVIFRDNVINILLLTTLLAIKKFLIRGAKF